jgi:hypothetical protein
MPAGEPMKGTSRYYQDVFLLNKARVGKKGHILQKEIRKKTGF